MLSRLFSSLYTDLWAVFLPDLCLLCADNLSSNEKYLCEDCWISLPVFPERSGQPFRSLRGVLDRLWIGWEYDYRLRQIIHFFKYHARPELGKLLINEWLKTFQHHQEMEEVDFIIPVPIHSARRRHRGFNQSEILATHLAERFGLQPFKGSIIRKINTPSQTTLDRRERWKSVEGAFAIADKNALYGGNVLIVDDLATSGATLHSQASLLKQCGAAAVSAAVLTSPAAEGQVM